MAHKTESPVPAGRRLVPPLTLAAVALALFAPLLLHPGATLYSPFSDLLAEHLPAKVFLVRSFRQTGELPLWCPYMFAGMPFVHDLQVGIFYPPYWLLFLVPEGALGPALSWLVVAHVVAAGWFAYAYGRAQGLAPLPAWVVGAGYMLSGKALLHLLGGGQVVLIGLAWLPLALLWLEQAVARRSFARATAAGAAYALLLLGTHPQWALYAGAFLAAWSLAPALESAGYLGGGGPRSWGRLGRGLGAWLACGAWALLVALALAAVQLLPTLEAAGQATRSATGMADDLGETLSNTVASLFGPSLLGPAWEYRAGLAVLWVAAAALAPALVPGRVRFQAGVCAASLLFGLGGGTLLQWVPGLSLFRFPSRALTLLGLPLALLAGVTTQALLGTADRRGRAMRWVRRALPAVAAVALASAYLEYRQDRGRWHLSLYLASLAVTVPAAWWLLRRPAGGPSPAWGLAWAGLLAADLLLLAGPLAGARPAAEVYAPSASVAALAPHQPGRGRALDRDDIIASRSPLGPSLPLLEEVESLRGIDPLDVMRYRAYLRFVSDDDGPPEPSEYVFDFPIRNKPLLDLLGVRYLVQPADVPPEGAGWRKVALDPAPRAYCYANSPITGGIRPLSPYAVYENADAFPRAFVVARAGRLPEGRAALDALKATDFRRTVLLEADAAEAQCPAADGGARPAEVRDYGPNRVTVAVDDGPPGYLVLTDVWYPGWTCTVDGEPAPVLRGDYLFRAVALPAGSHEVVFRFEPVSYRRGRLVSALAIGLVAVILIVSCLRR